MKIFFTSLLLTSCFALIAQCPTDINGNGTIDEDDLLMILASYGLTCEGMPVYDPKISEIHYNPSTEQGKGIIDEPLPFPICPNGSMRNIAGICDPTGLIFGLMPHPEAIYSRWLHPHFRRQAISLIEKTQSPFPHIISDDTEVGKSRTARGREAERIEWEGAGMVIFHNAVNYVREHF